MNRPFATNRIDALRLFVRIVERGSFTAAARDLRITQSTASKRIAELEAHFGIALVERTTRRLRITAAGRRLDARARDLLEAFDGLPVEVSQGGAATIGRIRISVPVVFGRLFVVPTIAEFLVRHPGIEAEIELGDRYVRLVEEGFDLAIRVGVPADTSERGRKLGEGRRVLVAAPSYLERCGTPRTPRDLKKHECVLHGDASSSIWRFRSTSSSRTARTTPITVHGRVLTNSSEAALEMVKHGLGIALLAEWLVAGELARAALIALLPRYAAPSASVYAITPPGRFLTAPVRAIIDHLAQHLIVLP